MENNKRKAILLSFMATKEIGPCNEYYFQKAVYFLQTIKNVPLGFDFVLHKQKVFSFDLQDEMMALRADNLFILHGPKFDCGGGSEAFMGRFSKTIQKYNSDIEFVIEKMKGKSLDEFEKIAVAMYMTILQVQKIDNIEALRDRLELIRPMLRS